jgi:hypothetical protein
LSFDKAQATEASSMRRAAAFPQNQAGQRGHASGKIHIRTDPVALPSDIPVSTPAPTGDRKVNVNKASDVDQIGDWNTVQDLALNVAGVTIDVPPGHYGKFSVGKASTLRFTAGDYSFASDLSLQGAGAIEVAGNCSINVNSTLTLNDGKILATGVPAASVRLNALGAALVLSGASQIRALVRAPNSNVTLNGGDAEVRGQLIAGRLTMNGGRIVFEAGFPDQTHPR